MQVEKYISELLYEHDCVIIPDFGGFICNYSGARIHSAKHRFSPPFKKISFNRNLRNNDGLLAGRITQSEKISYPESNRFILEYVERANKELSEGRRFDLKNIGTFYLGEESTILFQQEEKTNYLPDAFGLSTFSSPAVKRDPLERKISKTLKDVIIVPSKKQKDVVIKKRTPVAKYIAAAASLLLVASLVFVSLKTDLLKNTSFADLNPFASKPVSLYQPSDISLPESNNKNENISALTANDTLRYLNILLDGKIPVVVRLQDDAREVTKTGNHFYIIGGAFAIPANAEKFCNKLLKGGYKAIVLDKKGKALHFVSYAGFSMREDALQALGKIRAVQGDVWLMKN